MIGGIFADGGRHALDPGFIAKYLGIFWALAFLSYAGTFALGLPVTLVLAKWRLRTVTMVTGLAALCGVLLALLLQMFDQDTPRPDWRLIVLCAALASVDAIAFSLVAGFPLMKPRTEIHQMTTLDQAALYQRVLVIGVMVLTLAVIVIAFGVSAILWSRG